MYHGTGKINTSNSWQMQNQAISYFQGRAGAPPTHPLLHNVGSFMRKANSSKEHKKSPCSEITSFYLFSLEVSNTYQIHFLEQQPSDNRMQLYFILVFSCLIRKIFPLKYFFSRIFMLLLIFIRTHCKALCCLFR